MIIALDLETTGVNSKKDKILEVALIKFDENTFEIIDTFSTLINPEIPIPEVISNITNIFDSDVKNAPVFDENIIKIIKNFIGDLPILGHNTNFDRDFLIENGVLIEKNLVLDTFFLSNIIFFEEKSLNLGNLCEVLNLKLEDAHRALNDTKATILLFEEIIKQFKSLDIKQKKLLNFLFSMGDKDLFSLYKKLLSLDVENLSKEEFTKTILNKVKKQNKIEIKDKIKLDLNQDTIKEVLQKLPNSEIRENQLFMAKAILDSILNDKKLLIEAPTGVGKTFAYLIPSILKSVKTGEQVIISTNTKNLQDQIFYKDLEFLQKNLGYDFTYSKLKGKKNYLSISKYFEYLEENQFLSNEEVSFFSKITLWILKTTYGELDELTLYPNEYFLSRELSGDDLGVLSDENEFKNYEFLFKARIKAQNSNIVIVNHSLLIQDSISSQSLFKEVKNLIIDEAHNLEDTTTDASIESFSLSFLKDLLNKILNSLKKLKYKVDNLDIDFDNLYNQITFLFDILTEFANKKNTYGNEVFDLLIDKTFFIENKEINNLKEKIEINFIEIFNKLSIIPDNIYSKIKQDIKTLENILSVIGISLNQGNLDRYIPIFQIKKEEKILLYTVLIPGNTLKNILWDKVDNIILTSATLSINDSFDYIKHTLKLDDFNFLKLETDFDYEKQALLFIPNDLGSIKYQNTKIFDFCLDFLKIVMGKTLMLFTSYSSIKDTYLHLNLELKKSGISLLAQGVGGSKYKILNHFLASSNNSVLLGTDSFWEGIDIPGDNLKYLIIYKFPFLVPNDPILQARGKLYNNAFLEYSIPKAIIKTKQGFGRLIRTKKDNGIVVLLDDRFYSTSWGDIMKNSFPGDIKIKNGNSKDFLEILKNKLN
ncbi:DEAD/DEAH box helicase [Candidatus Gracilibacteria bacterium]|nr:DEAD/DEAH box helicase [Candidatus Gracilibacteria bacterium]